MAAIEECDIREILYDAAGVIETHARQRGIHLSMIAETTIVP